MKVYRGNLGNKYIKPASIMRKLDVKLNLKLALIPNRARQLQLRISNIPQKKLEILNHELGRQDLRISLMNRVLHSANLEVKVLGGIHRISDLSPGKSLSDTLRAALSSPLSTSLGLRPAFAAENIRSPYKSSVQLEKNDKIEKNPIFLSRPIKNFPSSGSKQNKSIYQEFAESKHIYWDKVTKEERLNFIMMMCGELGKSPEELIACCFHRRLVCLNNRTLSGLLHAYQTEGMNDMQALAALKNDLGIKQDYIAMLKEGQLIWSQVPREIKLNLIMIMCGELGKSPEALNTVDFVKKLTCLNNKALHGPLRAYQTEGMDSMQALAALKDDFGIKQDYIAMFKEGPLIWRQVPKEARLNFVMMMCGELGKSPEELMANCFHRRLVCLNNKVLVGLLCAYRTEGMNDMQALAALKNDLGIKQDYIAMFKEGPLIWSQVPREIKLNLIMMMCGELGKSPEALNLKDFQKKLACLNNKALAGLLYSYKTEGMDNRQTLVALKDEFGIKLDYIAMFKEGKLIWSQVPKEIRLNFVMMMCGELGKSSEALNSYDFQKKLLACLNNKTLGGLLYSYKTEGMDNRQTLVALKKDIEIKQKQDYIAMFKEGQLNWSQVPKEVRLNFVMMLCGELGKSPEALIAKDFQRKLTCFNNKSLSGLLNLYQTEGMNNMQAIAALKDEFGIKLDYMAMFKNGLLTWSQVPKEVRLNFIMMMCGELGKSPEALNTGDFVKKLSCLNNKALPRLLVTYQTEGMNGMQALAALKDDLGIKQDYIAMFKKGHLTWSQASKQVRLNFIMMMCGELNKSPEDLVAHDFHKKLSCLNNKALPGLLVTYQTKGMNEMQALAALKDDLGIKQDYIAMFKKGLLNWSQVPKQARLNSTMMMCGELGKSLEALNISDFNRKLTCLNNKSLVGLPTAYKTEGMNGIQALAALKDDLGIKQDFIAMFKKGHLVWRQVPKQARLNFIMMMCGELNKSPEDLVAHDFQKKLTCLNNKRLSGLLRVYQTEGMNEMQTLVALKKDLGIPILNEKITEVEKTKATRISGTRKQKPFFISINLISAVAKWMGIEGWPAESGPFSKEENKYTETFRQKLEAEGIIYPQQLLEKLNMVSDNEIELAELMSAVRHSAIKIHLPDFRCGKVPDIGYADSVYSSYQANVLRLIYILSGHTADNFIKYNGKLKGKNFSMDQVNKSIERLSKVYNGTEMEIEVEGKKRRVTRFFYPINGSEYEFMYSKKGDRVLFYELNKQGEYIEVDLLKDREQLYCPPTFYDKVTKTAITIFGRDFLTTRLKMMMLNEHYANIRGMNHIVIDQLDYRFLIREYKNELFDYFQSVFKEQKKTKKYSDEEFAKIVFDFKRFIEELKVQIPEFDMIYREGLPIHAPGFKFPTRGEKALEKLLKLIESAKRGNVPWDVRKVAREAKRIRKSDLSEPSVVKKISKMAKRRRERSILNGNKKEEPKKRMEAAKKESAKPKRTVTYSEFTLKLRELNKVGRKGLNVDLFIKYADEIVKLAKEGKLTDEQKEKFINSFKELMAKFALNYINAPLKEGGDIDHIKLSRMSLEKLKEIGYLRIDNEKDELKVYMSEISYELQQMFYEICRKLKIKARKPSWLK